MRRWRSSRTTWRRWSACSAPSAIRAPAMRSPSLCWQMAKQSPRRMLTKSSLMLGLGETDAEIADRDGRPARPRRGPADPGPVSAAHGASPAGAALCAAGRICTPTANWAWARASWKWWPDRWCVRAIGPSRRWRRTTPASAPGPEIVEGFLLEYGLVPGQGGHRSGYPGSRAAADRRPVATAVAARSPGSRSRSSTIVIARWPARCARPC